MRLPLTVLFTALSTALLVTIVGGQGPEKKSNPGPGDPVPDLVYNIVGGGQLQLKEFRGKQAVLIANHLVDDGPVSWLPNPFQRLKWFQDRYRNDLVVAVMPEYAHHSNQDKDLWKKTSGVVADLLDPGNVKVLIESRGERRNAGYGKGRLSLYYALNPEDKMGWWPMVLIDKEGKAAWSSQNPHTDNAEHMIYETDLREALMKLLEPEAYRKLVAGLPQDWVKQESPWGVLEVEDFERYRDLGEWHMSPCWKNNPPTTYKGELSLFPTRTGHRSLSVVSWMRAGYVFGFPYYYGYRDPSTSAIHARHVFPGGPRTGTLAFHAAAFLRAAEFDYMASKGKSLTFHLEGPDRRELGIHLASDGAIAGHIRSKVKWNPDNVWNRISFHVDAAKGTQIYLEKEQVATVPELKALSGIRFLGGWAVSVDDMVFVPKGVTPEELDKVMAWVDEQAVKRPHVTPLEREQEIARLARERKPYPQVLRVDWGSVEETRDSQGNVWKGGQPWLRGTWGYLDGDRYEYPAGTKVAGSEETFYRTVHYGQSRLRFTVAKGTYTLRVHTARPFGGPFPSLGHTNHGSNMPGWERELQMELFPDSAKPVIWKVDVPYRQAAVFEKKGIRVDGGLLDIRFNFHTLPHVAGTELIQESVDEGQVEGIPDWVTPQ